jgi:hypothetical protein
MEATPPTTVANKPGHRGEHEVTVKTIARGVPGYSGVTVVTMLVCLFYFACEAAGAASARYSLRPLIFRSRTFTEKLARNARRECEAAFENAATSLRGANGSRECAPDDRLRDEAIHSSYTWRDGLLRFARNDGLKLLAGLFEN